MTVSSTNLRYPVFQGTQEEAKTRVKKLQQGLLGVGLAEGNNTRKLINLKRLNRSGTESSFTVSSFSQPEERRAQTASYLKSLIDTLYPSSTATKVQQDIKAKFAAYINGTVETAEQNKNPGDISAERLSDYLHDLQLARLDAEAMEIGSRAEARPFCNEMPQKIEGEINDFLATKEIVPCFSQQVGEGNFGIVIRVAVKGDQEKYVYKKEKRDVSKALTERSASFWREGDCAAARLHDLSNLARPLFFIFRVSQEGKPEELHYVPTNHVKAFGMRLSGEATVFLEGQLMERASGESLDKIILKKSSIFSLIGGKHFNNMVRGLFYILKELQAHNLVHRDIKPENIFYNIETGEVTLIDFGSATRLRKKEKEKNDEISRYASTSTELGGTLKYISPRVLQQKPYGSEVDLFSFALVILNIMNPNEFEKYVHERFPRIREGDSSDVLFAICPSKEYLTRFLEAISQEQLQPQSTSLPNQASFMTSLFGSSGSSNASYSNRPRAQSMSSGSSRGNSGIARALERHQEIKKIIDLAFQASGGGSEGAAAYQELISMSYLQEKSTSATPDFQQAAKPTKITS